MAKKLKKKLSLNKKTVSNLNNSSMAKLYAGVEETVGCTPNCPTQGDLVTCENTCDGTCNTCVSCDISCPPIICNPIEPTNNSCTCYTDCKCLW